MREKLVVSVILIILIFWSISGMRAAQPAETAAPTSQEDYGIYTKAVQNKDLPLCNSAGSMYDLCIKDVSVAMGIATSCVIAGSQKDACFREVAVAIGNAPLCTHAASQKDQCFREVAVKLHDAVICESAGMQKEQCIQEVS